MKILSIFGTRPEAIKMAPVVRELGRYPEIVSRVCVTAQHRQMLDQVLDLFAIVPDYDLSIMTQEQSPARVASHVLRDLEGILNNERPDWVLVQGDTTTTAASALAAFYAGIRVGHVEAGLRTRDRRQPFPEEINRRLTGVIGDLHFAPTPLARDNLLQEGVTPQSVLLTGNTGIDALQWMAARPILPETEQRLTRLGLGNRMQRIRTVLVTAHRRENFGEPLEAICLALCDLARRYRGQIQIVYPVHPNPNVQQTVQRLLADTEHIILTEPLDYFLFLQTLKRSTLVLTDSGGIQEEAPSLGKPVLVLRDVTERPEGVSSGAARLVGTKRERIVAEVMRLLDDPAEYERTARAVNPYGDGQAARRIVQALIAN